MILLVSYETGDGIRDSFLHTNNKNKIRIILSLISSFKKITVTLTLRAVTITKIILSVSVMIQFISNLITLS